FAALAITPALVLGQFVGELVDVRLLGVDERIALGNLPVTRGHFFHQPLGQCPQLLRIQVIEGGCRIHAPQYAAVWLETISVSGRIYSTEIVPADPTCCQGRPSTRACHCSVSSPICGPCTASAQRNLPRFRRRAASHTPMPSCTSTFMRVARRLAKQ